MRKLLSIIALCCAMALAFGAYAPGARAGALTSGVLALKGDQANLVEKTRYRCWWRHGYRRCGYSYGWRRHRGYGYGYGWRHRLWHNHHGWRHRYWRRHYGWRQRYYGENTPTAATQIIRHGASDTMRNTGITPIAATTITIPIQLTLSQPIVAAMLRPAAIASAFAGGNALKS